MIPANQHVQKAPMIPATILNITRKGIIVIRPRIFIIFLSMLAVTGIFSEIGDMITFARMLSKGGDGYLSPAMFRKAIQCHADDGEVRRGLGFHLAGTPSNFMGDLFPACSFGHTGFTGTSLAVDPTTGFYVILLSNRVHPTRANAALMPFRRRFHNALYSAFSRQR